MKLPCAVVRDLLPLFAEKMTEPETQSLIEEHLKECPECQRRYSGIEVGVIATVDAAQPLRTLKREIRRRRWHAALIAGLLVFVALFACFYRADSVKPLPWQDGLVEVAGVKAITSDDEYSQAVRLMGEGDELPAGGREGLALQLDGRITGTQAQIMEEDDGTVTAILQGFGRSAAAGPEEPRREGEMTICPVPDRLIYGYGEPQQLLWGEPLDGGVEVLPRLAMAYYLIIAALVAALSGLLWLIFRNRRWSPILRQVFFAPAAFILAHILLMGPRTESFFLLRDLGCTALVACALYALLSLLWQAWLRHRRAA